jgi:hypothetical protein
MGQRIVMRGVLLSGFGTARVACAIAEPAGPYRYYGSYDSYYGAPYSSYYYPPYAAYGAFGYSYGSPWYGRSWHRPWHDGARFRSSDQPHRVSPPPSQGRAASPPPSQGAQGGSGSHRGFLGNVLRQRQQQ